MVLLTVAMTRTLVLLPPPRRCNMIVGPHLGCSTSLCFLLGMHLIKFNHNKTVMLDEDMMKLQVQIEITGVRLQLMEERFLRLHQRGYRLTLRSELLIVFPNKLCHVVDNGFHMRIIINISPKFCKHMELVTPDQERAEDKNLLAP